MDGPRPNIPRYIPRPSKAVEVILWLAERQPGIDIYHVVKAVFFADKMHVATYGRPIIGDQYEAAEFGPLARVVYGLLCFNPIEVLAASNNGRLPFRVDREGGFGVFGDRGPNLRKLSESDLEALTHGFDIVHHKSFDDIFDITHADPAYLNAEGGLMDYRDFLDASDPERDEKADDLLDVARYAVL